jgi:hypothetical protein
MPSLQSFSSPNRYTILDSGATGTFVTSSDAKFLLAQTPVSDGPTVLSANGDAMPITLRGQLPLSKKLSSTAQSDFVLDDLKTGTLISLAKLCDDDCIAIFNKYDVKSVKDNEIIIKGNRMPNGLWLLPLLDSAPHQANGILRTDRPKQELAKYLHTTLGSPVPSTLLRAIRSTHLTTFPGLTTNLISKHLPKSLATVLGHQDQESKHLRSTKVTPTIAVLEPKDIDLEPLLAPPSHNIFIMLFEKKQVMKSYSDQTGRFTVPSSRGNHYICVLYHQDTNTIHAVAIPNRQAASIRKAWESTQPQETDTTRPCARSSHSQQRMLSRIKRCLYKVQNRFSTCTSKRTSSKYRRTSRWNFQKSFYFHSLLGRLQFSNERMGSPHPSDDIDTQFTMFLLHPSVTFCPCFTLW